MKIAKEVLLLSVLSIAPCWAASDSSSGFLGGSIGLGTVSSGAGPGLGFGLEGVYFGDHNLGIGALLDSYNHGSGVTSFTFGGEIRYRLEPLIPGLSVAGVIGSTKFSGGSFTGEHSLIAGGKLSYDYRFSGASPVTVGADFGMLFTEPVNDSLTVYQLAATAKFWFP